MAEELLETVDRLQSRLQENQEPRKLVKALRRLGELPMTVEILVETGVGKAVNSLRKHDIVGELAKSLVAKWKKLVPQTADRPSNSHHTKPQSHRTEERGHKRVRDPSPEPSPEPSYDQDQEEDEEEGYNPNYSPQYGSPQRNSYQSDEYDSPQPELSPPPASPPPASPPPASPPPPSPPPLPPRKDPKQSSKPSKEAHKNHHHSRDRAEERRPSDRREGKKRDVERERQHSPEEKAPKHKRSTPQESKRDEKKSQGNDGRPRAPKDSPTNGEEEEFEAPSMSFESFLTYDAPISVKKKKKPGPASSSSTAISSSSSSHTRASHSSSSSSSSRPSASAPPPSSSSQSSSSLPKVKKSNGSSKRPHSSSKSSSNSGPPQEKRKKMVEPVPTLPDIPLPAIQPNYRPLPSLDVTPLSPQRRKVAVCNDDEDAGFTGKRLNSKMVVFSGSKTSYLPRMMTLFEQCIRVLQNNIDSIAEVGGVPFEILEPVLERCTPEQLYRIEQSNQCFTEDSDELWMRHCQRDFKREQPQEYESWRELYLRLHDEREERLRMLTQNISSAHASKPKGRQVKMAFVNSVAKPPRDIRRRQERFGTSSGSSAASTAAAAPIKVRPVFTAESLESRSSSSASSSSLSQSSLLSAPRSSTPSVGSSPGASARDKPQVKKIAPMMAKTIKAFKNRFSRR